MDVSRPVTQNIKTETFYMAANERILDMKVHTKGNIVTSVSVMVMRDL